MSHTHWGNETTAYGTSLFEVTLGAAGGDVKVSRITGHVSASPQGNISEWNNRTRMRQALVVIGSDAPAAPASTRRLASADRTNNEVDGSFGMINPKVFAFDQVIIPFDFHFVPPVPVPKGRVWLQIDNEGPGALNYDKDTLNVEVHMTIQWD
jgi:hypothetical protein